MSRFVILGTQRTGTTLIATSLNSHPEVECLGECFKAFEPRGKVEVADSGYLRYRQASFSRRLAHLFRGRRLMRSYLDELYAPGRAGAIGFKLMYNQYRRAPLLMDYLREHQVKAVNVYRENVVKTLVSRLSARATGVFHATQKNARPTLVVSTTGLVGKLEALEAEKSSWLGVAGSDLPLMRVCYEKFVPDGQAVTRDLLGFLGVRQLPLDSPLKKLNPDRLSDIVANFDELAAALAATPFARYLGDSQ